MERFNHTTYKDTIWDASGRVGNGRGRSDIVRGVVEYILLPLEPPTYKIKI